MWWMILVHMRSGGHHKVACANSSVHSGKGRGTVRAVEEARELLVQCLHSHPHTNRTLDSLNSMECPPRLPPQGCPITLPFLLNADQRLCTSIPFIDSCMPIHAIMTQSFIQLFSSKNHTGQEHNKEINLATQCYKHYTHQLVKLFMCLAYQSFKLHNHEALCGCNRAQLCEHWDGRIQRKSAKHS